VTTPAAPAGTGPFTWTLVTATLPPASVGTVTINPSTGAISFTPAADFSGPVPPFDYRVTDPSGASSADHISFTIIPAALPFSVTVTNTGAPITFRLPTPGGRGPFTWLLVVGSLPPTSDGTVTLDSLTGVITFRAALGFSGRLPAFQYVVTDASGTTSAPATVDMGVLGISVTALRDAAALPVAPETGAAGSVFAYANESVWLLLIGLLLCRRGSRRRRHPYLGPTTDDAWSR
jgi:hypothetical protein